MNEKRNLNMYPLRSASRRVDPQARRRLTFQIPETGNRSTARAKPRSFTAHDRVA